MGGEAEMCDLATDLVAEQLLADRRRELEELARFLAARPPRAPWRWWLSLRLIGLGERLAGRRAWQHGDAPPAAAGSDPGGAGSG